MSQLASDPDLAHSGEHGERAVQISVDKRSPRGGRRSLPKEVGESDACSMCAVERFWEHDESLSS